VRQNRTLRASLLGKAHKKSALRTARFSISQSAIGNSKSSPALHRARLLEPLRRQDLAGTASAILEEQLIREHGFSPGMHPKAQAEG
jgi:hypothetical protein